MAQSRIQKIFSIYFSSTNINEAQINSNILTNRDRIGDNKLPILMQAKDTAQIIATYLDSKNLLNVSKTCHDAYSLFHEPLIRRAKNKLLQYVAQGKQDQVEAILKGGPELLLKSGTVRDFSGRIINNVTPFELAYGADDLEMCRMMLPYFNKIKNGRELALKQIEAFSEFKKDGLYDFSRLVTAITTNIDVDAALQKFRDDFKPGTINKGEKHFNMQILLKAHQSHMDNSGTWSREQYNLFWVQVIGYLQRMLPACYAQAFCQGIPCITVFNRPLQRSLKLGEISFYPTDLISHSGLGFEYVVTSNTVYGANTFKGSYMVEGRGYTQVDLFHEDGSRAQENLKNLCITKIMGFKELFCNSHNFSSKWCVIS